ncbi:MAG: ABC transporter substrate-binding protein [Sphaerochaetaceae bacterium]|nr:ABC transporter substrate-binding protein [Sphaerochaetaceae bacterium]MDC7238231.1 ABC transporter substrate-binding protein [Sphaerochaetaceae bacterium]MDC7243719.1 ABC transporter substrate-binding protein [Sphaerochaetaceae bacterium]MDC7248532.1 ABC transporter substrate-binding protein [Sphaerochaetaceae bacterium]
MKRKLLINVLIICVIFFSMGCKDKTTAQTDIIRVNIASEPDSLDPWLSAAVDTKAIFNNVFEGLMKFDSTGDLYPAIAKNIIINETQDVYTFELRENVYFHNDKHLTSDDVVYTYENLHSMSGDIANSASYSGIEKVEALDDYTVRITLEKPSSAFLSTTTIAILPRGYDNQSTFPIGTGPYKFVEYQPSQKIVLERFDKYYNEEKMPEIKTAEIYIISDEASVVSALKSNQLDLAIISSENAKILEDQFKIDSSPMNMVVLWALNNSEPPFDSEKVRLALNLMVNRDDIVNGVFGGYATKLYTNFSPIMKHYYNEELDNYYQRDLETAKALLKEAGYEDGFEIDITVPSNYYQHVNSAQIISSEAEKLNIKVNIKNVEWGTWLEEVYTNRNYQSTIIGLAGKIDPNDILSRYETSYKRNFINYSNPKYDEVIEAAAKTIDDDKRVALYREAQQILSDTSASVWLCDPNNTAAMRKDLVGYEYYPAGLIDFSAMRYEK